MASYQMQRYLLMTTDPVHIGTGGYRLGRVDNSIVREPGTRIPKIPGTSLHGAARSYAARLYENVKAAGKDHDGVRNHAIDPVCYTFGYATQGNGQAKDAKGKAVAYSGVVNVFDAHIVFFPVHSMVGPVWVSTLERLKEAGFEIGGLTGDWDEGDGLFSWDRQQPLNLGWLMIGAGGGVTVTAPGKWLGDRWDILKGRIVLVWQALFSQVVNSNLEVRTSVSIDPERGAAEDKALFTYEAMPRATFLCMDSVLDDYREAFPEQERLKSWLDSVLPDDERKRLERQGWLNEDTQTAFDKNARLNLGWSGPADVLKSGLQMMEWLGVGGMGTRGFGRISMVGQPLTKNFPEEDWQ